MPTKPIREFTVEDLGRYDGLDGSPSFVGLQGKVYDVSKSFLWKDGRHQATHQAGTDLTDALGQAPHGLDLLEKFPVVGVLVEKSGRQPLKGEEEGPLPHTRAPLRQSRSDGSAKRRRSREP